MSDNEEILKHSFIDSENTVKTIKWYITEMNLHGLKAIGNLTDNLFDKIDIH